MLEWVVRTRSAPKIESVSAAGESVYVMSEFPAPYDGGDDPLAGFDNRTMDCPACGRRGRKCVDCGQTHDYCLGHITKATSACCGHGLGIGHVIIGPIQQLKELSGDR